jgi:hypothetical protein
MPKEYIGDGVYADWNGYQIVVTTEDGVRTTNTIFMEADVFRSLVDYKNRMVKGDRDDAN